MISNAGLGEAKSVSTPLEQNKKFTTVEYDDFVHLGGCNDELLLEVSNISKTYESIVVLIKYTTRYIICSSTLESIYAKTQEIPL